MGPGKEMSVWLYNTETGSARKIEAPARGPARWVGNRYFYSSMGPGGIEPLKAYDPVKDQTTELPIRGFLAGATSDGKTLLIAGHPEDLAKNVAPREMQAGAAVHLATSQGKILQTICEAGDLSSAPTLSPEGKYVAFQSGPRGRPRGPRDPKDFSVRLIRAEDGQASSLSGMYSPIAVTDQGLVCAREVSAGPQAAPLVLLDLETDKATKLLDATGEATTSQAGKVYFLQEVEGKPGAFALKCVELKAR